VTMPPNGTPVEAAKQIGALRKARDLDGARTLIRSALESWPGDVSVLRAAAWCSYDSRIKPANRSNDRRVLDSAAKAARWVASHELSPGTPLYDLYDPTPFVVLQAARHHLNAEQFETAVELLQLLNPARLLPVSQTKDFPSPLTEWFSSLTKALTELRRWPDLITLSGSSQRSDLRGQQAQWVEYRFARAFLKTGQPEQALAGIDRALGGKSDAWIKVLRADILGKLGRDDEAIQLLCSALAGARTPEDLGFLVGGLAQLARLLQPSDSERAAAHLRVLVKVRAANGWPVKQDDRDLAALLGTEATAADDAELEELRRWWKRADDAQRQYGRVEKVLPNGGSGFLKADTGATYYFAMPRKGDQKAPPEGTRVSFVVVDGFDTKKNQATKQAVKLRVERAR
jgi:hypothetical protein